MMKSDFLVRRWIPWLKLKGLVDLDDSTTQFHTRKEAEHGAGARILLLGFFRTASSLLEELSRQHPELLSEIAVVDFNPQVHAGLRARGVRVIYGDISQRDTLVHAGIQNAQVLVCTVPDSLLKGITNARLVRQLRELNPTARILAPADILGEIPELYRAGADFVSVPRIAEAEELCSAIWAAEERRLDAKRQETDTRLVARNEVLP